MDPETKDRLDKQEVLLQQIYQTVEKTRKYFLWMMIASLVLFVLPLIIFSFVLPSVITSLTNVTGL